MHTHIECAHSLAPVDKADTQERPRNSQTQTDRHTHTHSHTHSHSHTDTETHKHRDKQARPRGVSRTLPRTDAAALRHVEAPIDDCLGRPKSIFILTCFKPSLPPSA